MDYVLLFLVFSLVTTLALGFFLFLTRGRRHLERRLHGDTTPASGDSIPELLLGDLTPALADQIPIDEEDRRELQRELRSAGYYRPTALMEYAALRVTLVIVPLVGAGVLALFTDSVAAALWVWCGGLVAAGLGYSVPRLYLYFRARARMHAIERGLPTMIDMLTLCLGAGLNVLTSLRRVTQALRLSYPVLADEMDIVASQSELRTLEFALSQFADRVGLPQVRNIAVILTQSENLGTDAVSILREYADNLRTNMRQRADEVANKAPFKLLFPAYLLALGAIILLVSPVALEFSEFRKNNMIGTYNRKALEATKNFSPNASGLQSPPPPPSAPEEP